MIHKPYTQVQLRHLYSRSTIKPKTTLHLKDYCDYGLGMGRWLGRTNIARAVDADLRFKDKVQIRFSAWKYK